MQARSALGARRFAGVGAGHLHARLGGYLKEWSFHLACMFGSCVVMFSWWHVNFFNTGLHSYGFTSGRGLIWLWYGAETFLILLGAIAWGIQNAIEQDRKRGPGIGLPSGEPVVEG